MKRESGLFTGTLMKGDQEVGRGGLRGGQWRVAAETDPSFIMFTCGRTL